MPERITAYIRSLEEELHDARKCLKNLHFALNHQGVHVPWDLNRDIYRVLWGVDIAKVNISSQGGHDGQAASIPPDDEAAVC